MELSIISHEIMMLSSYKIAIFSKLSKKLAQKKQLLSLKVQPNRLGHTYAQLDQCFPDK